MPSMRRCLCGSGLAWMLAWALGGCAASTSPGSPPSVDATNWHAWQAERRESIAGTNGWATLAGLHWLAEGVNTAGTNPTNTLVLEPKRLPGAIGRFVRAGQAVRFETQPGVRATNAGQTVDVLPMTADLPGPATVLTVGSVRFSLIQRGEHGERLGIRVRDPEASTRRQFRGLAYFPYNPAWRIEAQFVPHPTPNLIRLDDVTGGIELEPSPGAMVFFVQGTEHRLDVIDDVEEHDFFILFRDTTAGHSTYGSGRFLHTAKPDAAGRVILDFNFAYNPPCAFTAYATCPLPPRQNRLPFPIEAGERKYQGTNHTAP